MSDFRTRLTCNGTGQIIEKGELSSHNGASFINLVVSFARRRAESKSSNLIVEDDIIPIKFWAAGAEMIEDLASVDQYIYVELEVRTRGGRTELKARHFELLG